MWEMKMNSHWNIHLFKIGKLFADGDKIKCP